LNRLFPDAYYVGMLVRMHRYVLPVAAALCLAAFDARAADVDPWQATRAAAGLFKPLPGGMTSLLPSPYPSDPMPELEPYHGTAALDGDDDMPGFGSRPRNGTKYQRYSLFEDMDLYAGIVKDEDLGKLMGLQLRYHLSDAMSLTGRSGLGAIDQAPQGVVTFGLKFEF
jgi:hypothetical protein